MGKYKYAATKQAKAHRPVVVALGKRGHSYPWQICQACGLVFIKNAATAAAAKSACDAMVEA